MNLPHLLSPRSMRHTARASVRLRLWSIVAVLGLVASPAVIGATSAHASPTRYVQLANTLQTSGGYSVSQIATAYGINPLFAQGIDGSGETIALIEFNRYSPSDIQQFDQANGIPDPVIQTFYPTGGFTPGLNGETALDLEWAHALAPGATIQIYYIRNLPLQQGGWQNVAKAVNAATANRATTISMSFGSCAPSSGYQVLKRALASARQQSASVFVSSGDDGDRPGPPKQCGSGIGVGYPASDASVVSVGGTSLNLAGDGSIVDETAWQNSGGGKGKPIIRPNWQIASQLHPGKYRYVPDVAFLADPNTGAEVFYRGRWVQAGGTSLGAPAWAAIWTLVTQDARNAGKSMGAASSVLYHVANSTSYPQAFHDISQGSNGRYQAGPGWDPVTGWGTPDVANLAASVVASGS